MTNPYFALFKKKADLLLQKTGIKYDAKPYKDTIRRMLDGYCEAKDRGDEEMKDLYIGALLVRHWDKVKNLSAKCVNIGFEENDFIDWVFEAIELACKYRKWQIDPNVNAQQCINQCINTIMARHYYEFNLDQSAANYNVDSLSNPVGNDGEETSYEDRLFDKNVAAEAKHSDGVSVAKDVIQHFIDKNKIVQAIILDVIAFGDTVKTDKKTVKCEGADGALRKYTQYSHEFWPYKAVQMLSSMPEDYAEYFASSYSIAPKHLKAALGVLKRANSQKLYKEMRASLKQAKPIMAEVL